MTRAAAHPTRTLLRTLLAVLLAGPVLVAAVVLGAGPASAHDQLVASDPVDGAQLAASPAAITLTFNEAPLTIDPQIVVTDAAGSQVAPGAPVVDGNLVTLAVADVLPNGMYRVAWRVVSADGHPIEGTLGFTVAAPQDVDPDATAEVTAAAPPTTADPEPSPTASATASVSPSPVPAETSTNTAKLVLVVLGIVVVAGLVPAVALVLRRRQLGARDGNDDDHA